MGKRVCLRALRDDRLRLEFQAAAAREGYSAAKVLRELMASYVEMQISAAGAATKLKYGLEQCTAALVVRPEPGGAVKLLTGNERELEALADRQYGWQTDAYRNERRKYGG